MPPPSSNFAPLDALAYIDVTHPDYEAYALTLIEEEMVKMDSDPTANTSAEHYLNGLQHSYEPKASPLVQQSLDAIVSNEGRLPPPPTSYRPASFGAKPSGSLQNDVQAWKKAVADIKVTVEDENLRLMNLELLSSFGATAHLAHIADLTASATKACSDLKDAKMEVDVVNAERKAAQDGIMPKYSMLTRKWAELVNKNIGLEGVVREMENKKQKKNKE